MVLPASTPSLLLAFWTIPGHFKSQPALQEAITSFKPSEAPASV